jgi:hypothetical protein
MDIEGLQIVKSVDIPNGYSFRGFGGWLDNDEIIVNIMKNGRVEDLEEKSFIISIAGGEQ